MLNALSSVREKSGRTFTVVRETADRGIRFLSENHEADNWYLQIEMYDPHEPFDAPKKYQDLYPHEYRGPCADWPEYGKTDLYTEEELAEMDERDAQRARFASFRRSLNAITHDDISVRSMWQAVDGFSARFDAQAREYRYALAIDETPPVFMRDFVWHVGPLDVAAMERASRCLIGEQDFKSFCRASSAIDKPTCRNVMEVSFSEEERFGERLVIVKVVGSSFLHSMVRTIVGTLVEVGRGRKPESWVAEALAACDRTAAGETAPAQGLVFWEVRYDD